MANAVRPNILIITTDQQRFDSLGCYGSAFAGTPNIDRLAAEGATMDRAYCANPVCTPARASIFSGRYPSGHGAWNVGMNVADDVEMVSHRLARAGYRTHYVGKAHFQAFNAGPDRSLEATKGWEQHYPEFTGPYYGFQTVELSMGHTIWGLTGHYGAWLRAQAGPDAPEIYRSARAAHPDGRKFGGEAYDWDLPTRLHSSVWTAERTIDFLEHHDPAVPFLLAVGFQDPHHPHCVPTDLSERVDPAEVPLPQYQEGELADKPPHYLAARAGRLESSPERGDYWYAGQGAGFDYRGVIDEEARLGRAYYYSLVRLIDRELGRIMAALEARGLSENTLVIFTTDHGELLGDHGLWMKGPFHYEQLVRIPMLARWPGHIPAGLRTQALISQVDLVPTILAAAGVPEFDADGVDLLPVLSGAASAPIQRAADLASQPGTARTGVIVECVDDPRGLRLKTIVTGNLKLTYYHNRPWGELYDLDADPRELRNLWAASGYAANRQRLMGLLLDHAERLERRAERISYA